MKVELEIDDRVAGLLAVLDEKGCVENVLHTLIDHVQQGVYRPGSWEREWITRVWLEEEFMEFLVPGCPYGRENCEHIFQKPKAVAT